MGNFQNIFKRLRIASGLTQVEISERLGISRSTIGMYETGAREPDFETLERIADFFNVDTDYLIGRTDKTTILPESLGTYYINDETREIAQALHDNPDMRSLFDMSRKMSPERLKAHVEFMKKLYEQEHPEE